MSSSQISKEVVLIDPTGIKGGLDHYNDNLADALSVYNIHLTVLSNYKSDYSTPVFKFILKKNILYYFTIIKGFIHVLSYCRKTDISTVVLHSFSVKWIDLFIIRRLKAQRKKNSNY